MALSKIVSGGQTGVDRGALDAALECQFPCGGWCPPGRMAEDGVIALRYPLEQMPGGGYRRRTIQNILDSDVTVVIYFGELEGGTQQTVLHCTRHQKPHLLIDAMTMTARDGAAQAARFISLHNAAIVNVAGPRQSKAPQAQPYAFELVTILVGDLQAFGDGR